MLFFIRLKYEKYNPLFVYLDSNSFRKLYKHFLQNTHLLLKSFNLIYDYFEHHKLLVHVKNLYLPVF